jgi:hypothetical protein
MVLYEWNAILASSFLVPLHVYEVTLRNAISEAISHRYGADWPTNQVFQNSLAFKNKKALLSLLTNNGYQSVGKLLPELKLSWFEEVLTARHDGRIWTPYIFTTFPNSTNLTVQQLRKHLKDACFTIRKLRNRIAHHEPIFNQSCLPNVYPLIQSTIALRCQDTQQWLSQLERVNELLLNRVL